MIVDDGQSFNFAAYDYGPFDSDVYAEARHLRTEGRAVIAPSGYGRWDTYAASELGIADGQRLLESLAPAHQDYIRQVADWVLGQLFTSLVKSIYETYPEMRANSIFQG